VARAGLGERIDNSADHRKGGDLSISAGRITFRGTIRRIVVPQARGFRLSSRRGPNNCRQRLISDFRQLGRILAPHRLTDTFATVASRVHVLDCDENCDMTAPRHL